MWPVFYDFLSSWLDRVWNVMAHAQKPDFVFRRNGRVHLNWRGASVQSTAGSRCVRISGSNAGYTMFWGGVKGTGYPPHSPVSPFTSPTVRHLMPSHFNWTLPRKAQPLEYRRETMKWYWSDKPNTLYILGTDSLRMYHCVVTVCHWLSPMIRQSVFCAFPLKSNENLNYVSSHQMAAVNSIGLYVLIGIIMSAVIAGRIAIRSHTNIP